MAETARDGEVHCMECALYRRLLDLGTVEDLQPFIEAALAIVVDLAEARCGYLELRGCFGGETEPRFRLAHGESGDGVEDLRATLSQTVIEEAITTGESIVTTSALNDPRFAGSGSVKRNRIDAVLCVPIGEPPLGVIYLQGRRRVGPFHSDDQRRVETFARHLAPYADRLILRHKETFDSDPTRPFRALLNCDSVIGRSSALARVLQQLTVVAPHDVSVLLTGATGTGKTQLARVLHQSGPRAGQAFVEVNCATLPETLVENELFGAVAGGHSAALAAVNGKVAAAHGGTLFLDEIGELALSSQAKLLQFLQSGMYYPLGSSKPHRADVRLITATNTDIDASVREGRFREDLYYRLQILPIRVPSLAERTEDIRALAKHFCEVVCARSNVACIGITSAAIAALEAEEWPGNVRQLANVIEAGTLRALSLDERHINVHHLFPDALPDSEADTTFQSEVTRFKISLIRRALRDADGNVTRAAQGLDIARSYLNKLIRRYRIEIAKARPKSGD